MKWYAIVPVLALVIFCSGCIPAKPGIKSYQGIWFGDDFEEKDIAGHVFRAGTTLELHVAGDGQGGTLTIIGVPFPAASTITTIAGKWVMEGPDKGVFQFNQDGLGNTGTGTLVFQKDRIKLEIKRTNRKENSPFRCVFYRAKPSDQ